MATTTHETATAASIAAHPGLSPETQSAIENAARAGAELMRLQTLRILRAELDHVTALRIAELVMRVEV